VSNNVPKCTVSVIATIEITLPAAIELQLDQERNVRVTRAQDGSYLPEDIALALRKLSDRIYPEAVPGNRNPGPGWDGTALIEADGAIAVDFADLGSVVIRHPALRFTEGEPYCPRCGAAKALPNEP